MSNQTAPQPYATIFTDGACEPNPGPGGYAAIVEQVGHAQKTVSGGFRLTTNNRMEILAAIKGLESLSQPSKVTLTSDSRYLVDAMTLSWALKWRQNNWWRNKKERAINSDLWGELLTLCAQHDVTFEWTKGHAGHPQNELCDRLSLQASRRPNLPADDGYENPTILAQPILKVGAPCQKCNTPLIRKTAKSGNAYLLCPNCRAMHMLGEKALADDSDVLRLF